VSSYSPKSQRRFRGEENSVKRTYYEGGGKALTTRKGKKHQREGKKEDMNLRLLGGAIEGKKGKGVTFHGGKLGKGRPLTEEGGMACFWEK